MKQQLHSVMRWWRQCNAQASNVLAGRRWSSALALGFLLLAPLVSQTASANVAVSTSIVYKDADVNDVVSVPRTYATNGTYPTFFTSVAVDSDGNGSTTGAFSNFSNGGDKIKFGKVAVDKGSVGGVNNLSNYTTSNFVCFSAAVNHTQTITPNTDDTLDAAFNDHNVNCTVTVTYQNVKLVFQKTWVNAYSGESSTIPSTTGFVTNTGIANNTSSFTTTSSGSDSFTSSPALTLRVSQTGTLPAEIYATPGHENYYSTSSYICTSGSMTRTVAQGGTLSIPNNLSQGAVITCTLTSTNQTVKLNIIKYWDNGNNGETATMNPTTGFTNKNLAANTSSFSSTADGTVYSRTSQSFSTIAVIDIGSVGNFPTETFSADKANNYTKSNFSCVYPGTSGPVTIKVERGAAFTIPSDSIPGQSVDCTTIDKIIMTNFVIEKIWRYGAVGDSSTINAMPAFGTQALPSQASGGGSDSFYTNTVQVKAGSSGILPLEVFPSSSMANNYLAGYVCSYSGSASEVNLSKTNVAPGATLTLPAYPQTTGSHDFTCVLTNTFKNVTLILSNTLVNALSSDSFTLPATTSLVTNTATLTVTSNTSGSTAGVIVRVGTSVTLPTQTFGTGTYSNNYNTTGYVCSDSLSLNAPFTVVQGVNFTMPVYPDSTTSLTCTLTNTIKPTYVVIQEISTGAVGPFNFAMSGLNNTADSVTTTTSGTAVTSSLTSSATANAAVTITQTPVAGYVNSALSCTDTNGISNTVTAPAGSVSITLPAASVLPNNAWVCTFSNSFSLIVSGQVFLDNGAGGGTPNDGVMNGAEAGQSGVLVQLTDCSSSVLSSTNTDATGKYSFIVPNATVTGANLCVLETNSRVRLSTGASVGATALPSGTSTAALGGSYTYTRSTTPDQIALLWNGSGHTGLNFGDVDVSTFSANSTKSGMPNITIIYPHIFTAGTAGSVSFSISNEVSVPTSGWSKIVFADPTCSGTLLTGATQLYPAAVATAVTAGQIMCVILQERIPASAAIGDSNDLKLVATMSFSNAAPGLSAIYSVEDITSVTASALALLKEVRNVTQSGSPGLNNYAKSGETLEYRITYTNNGTASINNLVINDVTPLYTAFVSSVASSTPAALTGCVKNTPVNPSPAAGIDCAATQVAGGSGVVNWIFTGQLNPGATGTVLFTVKVN